MPASAEASIDTGTTPDSEWAPSCGLVIADFDRGAGGRRRDNGDEDESRRAAAD